METIEAALGMVVIHPDKPGKILVVKEGTSNEKYGKEVGMYSIPIERIHSGDSIKATIARGIEEETGYTGAELKTFHGIYLITGGLGLGITVEVVVKPNPGEHDEITEVLWLKPDELLGGEYKLRPAVAEIVGDYLEGVEYPLEIINDLRKPSS